MKPEAEILIVDDEVNIRSALVTILEKRGHPVVAVGSGEEAWAFMQHTPVDLLLTDIKLPGMGGIELLRRVKDGVPETEVVVMTAYGSVETAVEAMRLGAYDYVTKPIEKDRFPVVVEKALERRRLAVENRRLRQDLQTRKHYERMIGNSEPMHQVYELIEQVAGSDITVLIVGESGTGKELVARAMHQKSPRAEGPFVTLNCGALPDNLFESELFGYERGAFTGAVSTKAGRFELADGGTLFLDEVGELSPKAQVDFLRVLETKEFRRLGGTRVIKVNTRVLAATNRNLEEAVKSGAFRDDLYYRLNVIPIQLPPLRNRSEDIPLLVESFLAEFIQAHQKDPMEVSPSAMRSLKLYSWPGNIRELRNVIERLVVTVREKVIQPVHLPPEVQASREEARTMVVTLGTALEGIEREVIRRTLAEVTNHRERAAALLGISARTLQYKIKEYGIKD
ncbi:MAG: sigma-54-dependent Fis family transcriptional regulator [Nitrospiraceae bacterium]|nr:MAG: sigma-54-dependent Fis family transcriptional regulator [Nitrospiraceae bacterium]